MARSAALLRSPWGGGGRCQPCGSRLSANAPGATGGEEAGCIPMAACFCMHGSASEDLRGPFNQRPLPQGWNLGAYRPHATPSITGALVSSIRCFLHGLADARARPGGSNVRKAEVRGYPDDWRDYRLFLVVGWTSDPEF